MCGIVGIFDTRGAREIDPALVKRMNETQHHRGPDEGDVYTEPGVGFGHRRLSVIDILSGQQPMFNVEGNVGVVFNGDPGALTAGLLGDTARAASPKPGVPSLSAYVWAFAATPTGPRAADLVHHNVFFTANPQAEFGPIGRGQMPEDPTLYICAEDRAAGQAPPLERFEIILNAPANRPAPQEEADICRNRTFPRLVQMGLTFTPTPQGLTTPTLLAQRFPGSRGAIYGRSPEGTLAAFQRPQARTALPGLYLAGGAAHPGAGVPMAALSGQHAAEAMIRDLTSA